MKALMAVAFLVISLQANASDIKHKILPGSLHTGGEITIKIITERQADFDAEISYTIKPKPFVPLAREYRSGTFVATLPIAYLDERGYQELATDGTTITQGAKLQHLGLETVNEYIDSHHVRLTPESSKWELDAWYHPSVDSTGWAKLALELQVPIIGKYKVYSEILD